MERLAYVWEEGICEDCDESGWWALAEGVVADVFASICS